MIGCSALIKWLTVGSFCNLEENQRKKLQEAKEKTPRKPEREKDVCVCAGGGFLSATLIVNVSQYCRSHRRNKHQLFLTDLAQGNLGTKDTY